MCVTTVLTGRRNVRLSESPTQQPQTSLQVGGNQASRPAPPQLAAVSGMRQHGYHQQQYQPQQQYQQMQQYQQAPSGPQYAQVGGYRRRPDVAGQFAMLERRHFGHASNRPMAVGHAFNRSGPGYRDAGGDFPYDAVSAPGGEWRPHGSIDRTDQQVDISVVFINRLKLKLHQQK